MTRSAGRQVLFGVTEVAVVCILAALAFQSAEAGGGHHEGGAELIQEPPNSKVTVLTYDTHDQFIERHPLILLYFYAPWCGHCQQLAPNFREAAALLHEARADLPTPVVLAKFDDSDEYNRNLRAGAEDMYNYTSYPSLFIWKQSEKCHSSVLIPQEMKDAGKGEQPTWCGKRERYIGGRDAHEIADYMTYVAKGLDPIEEEKKTKPGLYKKRPDFDPLVFADLDEDNFQEEVLENPNAVWIIEFYSDHCPICKALEPEMIKAAEEIKADAELRQKVRIGGVNSRVNWDIPEKWGVTSYPWVACFYKGKKCEAEPDMAGLSGAASVVNWSRKQVEHNSPPGEEPVLRSDKHAPVGPEALGSRAPSKSDAPVAADNAAEVERDEGKPLIYGSKDDKNPDEYQSLPWREQLGRHAWFYLHTLAATYPAFPSEEDKNAVRMLVASFGQLFPCKLCRRHLQGNLADAELGPVAVESREALSIWMCKLHNSVNRQNGKAEFPCEQHKLDLMYLKSCSECKEKFDDGAVHQAMIPWSASLYARDPVEFQQLTTEKDMYETADVNELLSMAVEYNVLPAKKEKKFRDDMKAGAVSKVALAKNLQVLLRPIFKLKKEISNIERADKEARAVA